MTQTASPSPPLIDTEKLNGLLSELRDLGQMPIGIGEEVAMARLLAELIAQDALSSLEDVRGYLAPLLTRSESDRQVFDQAFARWFSLEAPVQPSLGKAPEPGKGSKPEPPTPYRELIPTWLNRVWPWIAGALALVYLAVFVRPADLSVNYPTGSTAEAPSRTCSAATPQFCNETATGDPNAETDRLPVDSPSTGDRVRLVIRGSFGYCRRSNVGFGTEEPEFYSAFAGAPTLEELAFVSLDFTDPSASNAASYCYNVDRTESTDPWPLENSVGLVAGLPVNRPLPVAYDPVIAGRIAHAIGVLSNDPNLAPLSEYVAAAEQEIRDAVAGGDESYFFDPLNAAEEMRRGVNATGYSPFGTGADTLFRQRAAEIEYAARGQAFPEDEAIFLDNPMWRRGGTTYRETTVWGAFWYKSIRPIFLVVFLALLAVWMANGLDRRKAFLRRRRPLYPPSIHNFVTKVARETPFSSKGLRKTIQSLQQWTSRESERLDIDKTLDRTLKEGVFSPVRAEIKGLPEYLILIETRGNGDQETQRLRSLVRRLEDAHILVSVYYYEGNPYWCRAETGGINDGANPLAGEIFTIEELKMRYPEHRLIVLGEGETFVDPVTEIANPGARALMNWDERAMLTPAALRSWGTREFTIAQALKLPLGRASEEGTTALPALLGLDGRDRPPIYSEAGDGFARSVPLLIETRAERWLGDAPILDSDWTRLDAALRSYLDPISYVWLSACAVYPELRWDLTLYLGQRVDAGAGQPLYTEARLADLLKLPWFRSGRMPDWFRARLIERLEPSTARQVRSLLRKLIDDATEGGAENDQDALRLRIATVEPGTEMPLQDTVFLDFLVGGQTTDFELDRDENEERRTARRGRRGGDQISKMLWKAGLLWGLILVAILPFGGQLGLLDTFNPVDMVFKGSVWDRYLFLAFGAIAAAALSLFLIDPSSMTYRRWHTFSSFTMFTLVATILIFILIILVDGPLFTATEATIDFVEGLDTYAPSWLGWFFDDGAWVLINAAIFAGLLHFFLHPLGARLGLLPATRDVPLRRRIVSSVLAIPVIGALTIGVGFIIIGSAVQLSDSNVGRMDENIWHWGNMANWPILLMMIGLWALVLRGLVGLSRRWRRLALAPPPPINRRGHRLMTTSIIVRVIGLFASGIALLALPGVGDFVFDGVVFGVVSDVLDVIFPGAGNDSVEMLALLLSLPAFLAPGIGYAWWLDRRQSPDIGVSLDFRGRGKAFMVALARAFTGAVIGLVFVLPVLIFLDETNATEIAPLFGVAIVFLVLAELIARFFSGRARNHRQKMPTRTRAPEAFGPPWLKWSGVGAIAASTMLAWVWVLATIPPEQRFGPQGPTSIALNSGPALSLADETGEIRHWSDREFGFAESLSVDPTLDGVFDPIVRVSVDPVLKFDGCVAYRRQSGVWQVQLPDGSVERLDTQNGFQNVGLIVSLGEALLMTQQVQGAFRQVVEDVVEMPTQSRTQPNPFSKEPPQSTRALTQTRTVQRRIDVAEQHVLRLVECESGDDLADEVMLRAGLPTALSVSGTISSRLNADAMVGFSDGAVERLPYSAAEAVLTKSEDAPTLGDGNPVIGFSDAGLPIQINAISVEFDQSFEQGSAYDLALGREIEEVRAAIRDQEAYISELEQVGETQPADSRGQVAESVQDRLDQERARLGALNQQNDLLLREAARSEALQERSVLGDRTVPDQDAPSGLAEQFDAVTDAFTEEEDAAAAEEAAAE